MPKNQKSSATSATRKKHARKAVGGEQLLPLPKEKKDKTEKRGKGKHAEPRQKIYIPPSKPAPVRPDPLTSTGLASRLPPDLLVILRRLAKKDPTTRQKAVEELNAGWLARVSQETEATLTVALPAWVRLVKYLNEGLELTAPYAASPCSNPLPQRFTETSRAFRTDPLRMAQAGRPSISTCAAVAWRSTSRTNLGAYRCMAHGSG